MTELIHSCATRVQLSHLHAAASACHTGRLMPDDESTAKLQSLQPAKRADRLARRRISWRGEFALALVPTAVILIVLAMVEVLSDQRLLFASLASSAFLIYLDPKHGTNRVRTLVVSQLLAASLGFLLYVMVGPLSPYIAAGTAMVLTISLMILLDAVHPPAVSTSLAFAFRTGQESNLVLFALAVAITATLVILQKLALWALVRWPIRRSD